MTVARFWREQKARYTLLGSQCKNCGKIFFPERVICPICHRESVGKMEPIHLSPTGTIESYTVIYEAPPFQRMQVPYIMAIIHMDDGPRLTAQIVDTEPEMVDIGKRVRAVFRKVREDGKGGAIYYGYKFVLAE